MTKEKARPGSGRLAKSNRNKTKSAPEIDVGARKRRRGRKSRPGRTPAPALSPALSEEERRRQAIRAEAERCGGGDWRKKTLAFLALVYRHERGQPAASWRDYVCHCGKRAKIRRDNFPRCREGFSRYWRCPHYLDWRAAQEEAEAVGDGEDSSLSPTVRGRGSE